MWGTELEKGSRYDSSQFTKLAEIDDIYYEKCRKNWKKLIGSRDIQVDFFLTFTCAFCVIGRHFN